jgi:putative Mn2+ efflux pump MntP
MSGLTILGLAVGLAMDALAVAIGTGLVLGCPTRAQTPSVIIGLVAFAFTVAGMLLGSRVGRTLGGWPEVLGGLVLLAIGAKILAEHLGG